MMLPLCLLLLLSTKEGVWIDYLSFFGGYFINSDGLCGLKLFAGTVK